ncbi:hypothetical protein ABT294_10475 [Nonomuraea sp. NPDC000554]|uniref:hypothetical protein n=1 Tax=Nonomuraea sp. NPDC000554 TaxID=3154259 RepID=UPI003332FDA8
MAKDLVRGGGAGLLVALVLGQPVSQWYDRNVEGLTALASGAIAVLLIVPIGWLAAKLVRVAHPVRVALLGPLLLWVFKSVVEPAVPDPSSLFAVLGFVVLAVVTYAAATWLTGVESLLPRVIAAGVVCACVITSAMLQERQEEARKRQVRRDWIAALAQSGPRAVPDAVPGRTLVGVWTLSDEVLTLDYAKDRTSEPDVFVQIHDKGDPRESCAMWVQGHPGLACERLAADRWLSRFYGRLVLFAKVGDSLVQVDSKALSLDQTIIAGTKLRAVSAEYLADAGAAG